MPRANLDYATGGKYDAKQPYRFWIGLLCGFVLQVGERGLVGVVYR